jgi:glycosyltransferase involved in cell wall biosynthesis
VGGDVPAEIMAYESENVRIMGHISDVDSIFERSRIFVAPLRYGAGMKGKVGHALSYGLPVVTTSIGAEGFGMRHRQEAMIVDEPQAFAEAVIQVYRSRELWQQLSDNGYTHLQRHFTPEVVAQKLRAAITKTSPGKKAEWLNTVYDMPTP